MVKYCAVFVFSTVFCNPPKTCFVVSSVIYDSALICRSVIHINDISVKYFRTFTFSAYVFSNVFAVVSRLKKDVVSSNDISFGIVMNNYKRKLLWNKRNIRCFSFLFIFCVNLFVLFEFDIRFDHTNLIIRPSEDSGRFLVVTVTDESL